MEAIGLLVTLEARAGKEADAEAFLKSAQPLALNEKGTLKWYAIKIGPGKFGIFDTFANDAGRNAHLTGEIAKALGARAECEEKEMKISRMYRADSAAQEPTSVSRAIVLTEETLACGA